MTRTDGGSRGAAAERNDAGTRAAMMAEKWLVEEGIPPVPRTTDDAEGTEAPAVAVG